MINKLSITLCMLCVLSACSSTVVPSKVGPNGEYIGWHCSGDIASEGNWHCEEKVLKDGQVVVAAQPAKESVKAQSQLEGSADRQVSNGQAVSEAGAQPSELLSKQTSQPAATDANSDSPTHGYSLQLGAYRSRLQAEQAAANMVLSGPVEIRDIISQGKPFSVILLGHYATRGEAESAAQYLTINYWIRSMRSLVNARAK